MVHIEKDFLKPPAELTDSKWNSLKVDAITQKNNHVVKAECYRDTTLEELTKLYSGKCACCERARSQELQVDHYRPKKARDNKTNTTYNHNGYYWLAYEWNNLIPLCSSCNNSKSNYFPIKGTRVNSHSHIYANNPTELYKLEQPLFINPEIEEKPERHFKYLPNGRVEGRTDEGKEMVRLYNLNSKPKIRDRKELIHSYIQNIREAINEYQQSKSTEREAELRGDLKSTFRRILNGGAKTQPLSLLNVTIRNYFNFFIAKQFPAQWHGLLMTYFTDYYNYWKKTHHYV